MDNNKNSLPKFSWLNDDNDDASKHPRDNNTIANNYGSQYVNYLAYISYIQLVCNIFSALFIWATIGTTNTVDSIGMNTTSANPYGIILGIIVIVSGIVLYILLQALSHILKNSIENKIMLIKFKQEIDKNNISNIK